MSEALRLADWLDHHGEKASHADAAAELRRLHSELERKSDAIQRLWKERDELRSENRTLVRQNGEWQEHNAELVEALRGWINQPEDAATYDACMARAEAALAKAQGESNG